MKKIIMTLLLISTICVFTGCIKDNSLLNTDASKSAKTKNYTESVTTDENGNKVIIKKYNDKSIEKEIQDDNKIKRILETIEGKKDQIIEETKEDGTKIRTHIDFEGKIHKYTEKTLGNSKRHTTIENEQKDGTIEKIEEEHEDLGNGVNKIIQHYQDGTIQEILMTHNKNENKNETTITYPDGRVEKTIEEFIKQPDGKVKVIKTEADGTKTERIQN